MGLVVLPQMMSSVQRAMKGKMSTPGGAFGQQLNLSTSTRLCSLKTSTKSSRILKWNAGVSILRLTCHLEPDMCANYEYNEQVVKVSPNMRCHNDQNGKKYDLCS